MIEKNQKKIDTIIHQKLHSKQTTNKNDFDYNQSND